MRRYLGWIVGLLFVLVILTFCILFLISAMSVGVVPIPSGVPD